MGNQALILMVGTLAIVALFVGTLMQTGNDQGRNAISAYSENQAREVNNGAIELALRTLADSSKYRKPFNNLQLLGGKSTVTFKDTLFGSDSAVVVRTKTSYKSTQYDSALISSTVVIKPAGFIPWVVRGAITAFGPLNKTLSDMIVDGRNWNYANTSITPTSGIYAVSTGAATFVNTQQAKLGGTTGLPSDIAPAYPHNSLVVETNASWGPAWPSTPDAAMGFTEGTLKQMAINKVFPGSQYVTAWTQLKFPLKGITYMEVPNGTVVSKKHVGASPEGIFVYHSPNGTAYWDNISVPNGAPFKGLMFFDRVFHFHMDVLGALVMLSPNTVNDRECAGNKDHWVRFSGETIMKVTGGNSGGDASWKSRLRVLAWYEQN